MLITIAAVSAVTQSCVRDVFHKYSNTSQYAGVWRLKYRKKANVPVCDGLSTAKQVNVLVHGVLSTAKQANVPGHLY